MKREITICDICEKPYNPAKEANEPMRRVGLVDPQPLSPQEEARLDADLKAARVEIRRTDTTPQAKAYYEERAKALVEEAEKRRLVAVEDRVDVDLVCHQCYVALREHVKQMKADR